MKDFLSFWLIYLALGVSIIYHASWRNSENNIFFIGSIILFGISIIAIAHLIILVQRYKEKYMRLKHEPVKNA